MRFSLRTILIASFLSGSSMTLYFHWDAWYLRYCFQEKCKGATFSSNGELVAGTTGVHSYVALPESDEASAQQRFVPIWNVNSGKLLHLFDCYGGRLSEQKLCTSQAFFSDSASLFFSSIVTDDLQAYNQIFNCKTGLPLLEVEPDEIRPKSRSAFAFSNSHFVVWYSSNKDPDVFESSTGKYVSSLSHGGRGLRCVAISESGNVIATSHVGDCNTNLRYCCIWDVHSGKKIDEIKDVEFNRCSHTENALSADGRFLAAHSILENNGIGDIVIRDVQKKCNLKVPDGLKECQFSSNSQIAVLSSTAKLNWNSTHIFYLDSNRHISCFGRFRSISSNGEYLFTCGASHEYPNGQRSGFTLNVFELKSGVVLYSQPVENETYPSNLQTDGRTYVLYRNYSQNSFEVIDFIKKRILWHGKGDVGNFGGGRLFVRDSERERVRVVDSLTGELLWELGDGKYSITLSKNGTEVVTIGSDNRPCLYVLRHPEAWWGRACLPELWLVILFSFLMIFSKRCDNIWSRNHRLANSKSFNFLHL